MKKEVSEFGRYVPGIVRLQGVQEFISLFQQIGLDLLCLLVRTNRAVLEPKDVKEICNYVSTLCKEEGCLEPSDLCQKASEAVGSKEEEKYLELCAQSCVKCGEAKRPTPKTNGYVS